MVTSLVRLTETAQIPAGVKFMDYFILPTAFASSQLSLTYEVSIIPLLEGEGAIPYDKQLVVL